jgi:hypothetical protein
MKKIILLFFYIVYLFSTDISVPSQTWNLKVPADGLVHVVYLPTDISLSSLQNSLADGQSLIVYNLAAYPSWMKQFTGHDYISAIKVEKDKITYLTLLDGVKTAKNDYDSFKTFIENSGLEEKSGFSLSNYLSYLSEIKAGGVYYIKSSGQDLDFHITFGNNESNNLLTPPSPTIGSSSSNSLETPPSLPSLQ